MSRDHHVALLFCWKIRQGVKLSADEKRINQYVLHFWENHLRQHFQEEENILFILKEDALCQKAVMEHREIEQIIDAMKDNAASEVMLSSLADLLDQHIRFEERTLFPHLEQKLSPEQLQIIGETIEQSHSNSSPDKYEDEFWKK